MNFRIPNIDLINLGILTAAILALLAAIELLRRRRQFSDAFSRKSVHVLTGFLIFVAPLLFPRAGAVVLIATMFVLLNLLAYRQGWLRSVHHTSRQSYGTPSVRVVVR